MPPRQPTLHAFFDSDAPHRSTLHGVQALARLRSPLAEHVREQAKKFLASATLAAGTADSPIILDSSIECETVTSRVPVELECGVCRNLIETPLVSVFLWLGLPFFGLTISD